MATRMTAIDGIVRSLFFTTDDDLYNCSVDKPCPLVTISRGYGALGLNVARLLADQLTVRLFDEELLHQIVNNIHADRNLVKMLDERTSSALDDWLRSMFSNANVTQQDFLNQLIKTVTAIGQSGGVILGRGAHLILNTNPKVFRVRIEGTQETCAKRIAERKKIALEEANEQVNAVNKERIAFVKQIYKRFPTKRTYYDLMLSSDDMDHHQMVDVIIHAMEVRGLYVPGSNPV
ncbi:AAA family ATPase [Magnetococcales bacterium HHB-1]